MPSRMERCESRDTDSTCRATDDGQLGNDLEKSGRQAISEAATNDIHIRLNLDSAWMPDPLIFLHLVATSVSQHVNNFLP
jgi:hypothetical protein